MTVLSLPDALAHLSMAGVDAPRDAKVTAMIAAAEAAIAERVGPLEPEARTVRVTPSYKALAIPSPAVELTSVTDSNGVALTIADLFLDKRPGLITFNNGQAFTASWYDIIYDYGRETCPSDLVLAVKEMVRHLWNSSQRNPTRRPGSTDSEATANTIPGAAYLLPFRVAELIAPHRPQLVAG